MRPVSAPKHHRHWVIWLVVWLLLVELGVRSAEYSVLPLVQWELLERHTTEQHMLGQRFGAPPVAILGNSRARDALAPNVLADAMRLPRGSIANLGLSAGTASSALYLYTHHREELRQAELVLLALDDCQFNASWPAAIGVRFKEQATLWDRLAFPVRAKAPDLVLGFFWRTWDLRADANLLATQVIRRRDPRAFAHNVDELGRIVIPQATHQAAADYRLTANECFDQFTPFVSEYEALRELARLTAADGVHLVAVQLPLARPFLEIQEQTYAQEHAGWRERFQASLGPVEFLDWTDPEPWGLRDDVDFHDFGHMTDAGSLAFSWRAADAIQQLQRHTSADNGR